MLEKVIDRLPDYLNILFSWPVMVLVIVLILIQRFPQSIKKFLENITLKKAGPFEFETQKPAKPVDELIEEEGLYPLKDLRQLEHEFYELLQEVEIHEQSMAEKDQLIEYLYQRNEFNEFSYLNLALTQHTKSVLNWFYHYGLAARDIYHEVFTKMVPSESERNIIFQVLVDFKLLESGPANTYKVSAKGERFLRFNGFIY